VLFGEFDNLIDVVEGHEQVFQGQALHDLKYIINKLDEQVALFEFLSANTLGISSAQWNTFSDGARRHNRVGHSGADFYSDSRTGSAIPDELVHDPISRAMQLPSTLSSVEQFVGVTLKDGIVDSWGQSVSKISAESVIAQQITDNLWVYSTAQNPISRDVDCLAEFTLDGVQVRWLIELTNTLPAARGEYLITYDQARVDTLLLNGISADIGDIFFWVEGVIPCVTFDAIIIEGANVAGSGWCSTTFDALLEPKPLGANDFALALTFDAILVNGPTVTFDACLISPCSLDLGNLNYGYTSDIQHSHKEHLAGDDVHSDINNILDATQDTYWFDIIMRDQPIDEGVISFLELDLGGATDINYIDIDPVTAYPLTVDQISYITPEGNRIVVEETAVEISQPVRFSFPKVTATGVVLRLVQKNYEIHTYDLQATQNLHEIVSNLDSRRDFDLLTPAIKSVLNNTRLQQLLNLAPKTNINFRTVYEYVYGLDNVSAGLLLQKDLGVYVSKSQEIEGLGLIAFEGNTSQDPDGRMSWEFDLTKKDYDADGTLLTSVRFPVPIFNQASITNETLVLNANDTGKTRFRAHGQAVLVDDGLGAADPVATRAAFCSLRVYQNGDLLPAARWIILNNAGTLAEDANTTTEIAVSIDPNSQVEATAVYTVSYTPLHVLKGDQRDLYLDRHETLRAKGSGAVEVNLERGGLQVKSSKLWLTAVMRNNHPTRNDILGYLDEYRILLGEKSQNRFAEL